MYSFSGDVLGAVNSSPLFSNWETHAQLRARVLPWLIPYLERKDIGKLLIVSHGGVMRALLNQPSLKKIHYCEIRELTPDCIREG